MTNIHLQTINVNLRSQALKGQMSHDLLCMYYMKGNATKADSRTIYSLV